MRLAGKRALITGGGGAIGAAIARAFADEGARVLVTDRDPEAAERVASTLPADRSAHCPLDVTDEASWEAAIALAVARFGGLSVLVNNAGIAVGGTVGETSLKAWRRAFAVHAEGTFLGCRAALPHLRAAAPAAIVNVASLAAQVAMPGMAAYAASKAAVVMLTRSLAVEEAAGGVRANVLLPAWIDTPLIDAMLPPGTPRSALAERLAADVPARRLGTAAEIAAAAVYLASDDSLFTTGAELRLDGGRGAC